MSESLHSAQWYRVSGLRPALRPHLSLSRQVHRGEPWFVIHDPSSGRNWRFSSATERVIALMDGRRTVDELWSTLGRASEDVPTQDEIVRLLAQLHAADALAVDADPDVRELLERHRTYQTRDRMRRFGNPLAIRVRLFDPDAWLSRTLRFVIPLFGRWGLLAWCAVVVWGIALALLHADELGVNLSDFALSPQSLVTAILIYPVIKAVHELAHAYAVRIRGGEVHEIGVMWMLLMPIPCVDASAAAAFPERHARMLVSAAGILAEVFIAAVAMIVWSMVEPGAVRAVAYSVMLIAGMSTLLFNGNPLMRYDGYYVLVELLGLPNLARRANAQAGYVLRRWVLGLRETEAVASTLAEARWLGAYAVAAFAYRLVVFGAIVALVAAWSKVAALAVAAVYFGLQLAYPTIRALRRLVADPLVRSARGRALGRGLAATALLAGLCFIPLPLTTSAPGIVWLPENGEVRAGTDGVLREWQATPGSEVHAGQPLALLEDDTVELRLALADAAYRAADARHLAARANDHVDAGTMLAQLQRTEAEYAAALQRADARLLLSPTDGLFVVARPGDQPGRYFQQGDVVGYVVGRHRGTVLAVVSQDDIGLIKTRTRGVQVRLSDSPGEVLPGTIARLTPAGDFDLPSAALGTIAGGSVAVMPGDPSGRRTLTRVFRVELTLDRSFDRLGGRAYVRFDHGSEALVLRGVRRLRQLFLRHLDA